MRPEPVIPHKFGSGIPNPIGPATWRGVEKASKYKSDHSMFYPMYIFHRRVQKLPENWGPLVTNRLQFGTEVALFSQDQWKEIGKEIVAKRMV